MASIKFDARHGLTVGNGATNVINSDGTIASGLTGGAIGDILYQSAAGVTSKLSDVATGNVLLSGGVNTPPSYGKVGLTTHISGTLAVANGGTGVTSSTGSGNNVLSAAPTLSGSVTLSGGTVSTSSPVINATQTWNGSGIAFSGIKFVVTNTLSSVSSLVLDLQAGSNKFGVDTNGSVIQILATPNIARDIVGISGSRHIREYQDLNDDGVQGLLGTPGGNTYNFEWGYTWNAKWDTGSSTYIKDRNNAGDHAFMYRLSKKFNQEWWFSDGTSPGAISWVKRITFDLPTSTYTFAGTIYTTDLNVSNSFTSGTSTTNDLIVNGNFTVNGTATVINTTEVNVDDINITLGAITTPTDTTANGGGITLKGTTDKTITWNQSTTAWDFNQHVNIANTKTFNINGTSVLSSTTLGAGVVNSSLTSVGILTGGTWQANLISGQYGGTGVNNSGKTITLGGNVVTASSFTTSGQYALTLTTLTNTNVTLPATGTLATLAGSETLTAKTMSTGCTWNGNTIANAYLTNNTITVGTTSFALGASSTTLAGLTSVTSTGFTGALTGNASTATTLQNAQTINGISFNGSANITITSNTTNALTNGAYLTSTGTFDGSAARTFAVDAASANTLGKIVARDASGNFAAGAVTVTSLNALSLASATIGFTVAGGTTSKTLTINNTLGFSGTDGSTLNIGTGGTLGTAAYATISNYATLASPTFTGTPAAPTATPGTNTTQVATTAYAYAAATSVGAQQGIFYENLQTVTSSYTLTTGRNAMTAGPITIADGVTVTVPSGAAWTVV